MEEVAKISPAKAAYLKDNEVGLDIIADANGNYVIHVDEARALLSQTEYTIIEWAAPYIGAPRPRKRKL